MNIILIGGGKTTYFLARQFTAKGYRLTIINRDPTEASWLSEQVKALVILGEGSDPSILEEAGARRADVLLCLTPHDQDNLIACQLARQMFGVPRTIALVNDPENEAVFTRLGISAALSAPRLIATLLEQQVGFEDVVNLFPAAEGRLNVTEITLRPDAPAIGKTLQELKLPSGSLVVGIVRDEQVFVPGGASRLQVADRLLLVTLSEGYGDTLRLLLGRQL